MIEADMSKLDLGLSQENRARLLDTNVIFHAAATVRFNETIRIATNINIRGTKQLLLYAKEMPNLKVHKKKNYFKFSTLLILYCKKFNLFNFQSFLLGIRLYIHRIFLLCTQFYRRKILSSAYRNG